MRPPKRKATEQGVTLMECLVAMMVAAVIVTAISPALLIAFASRVQNYKADQAMKFAQGEIDRVRSVIEKGDYSGNWTEQLPPRISPEVGAFNADLNQVGAPQPSQNMGACPQLNVQGSAQPTTWCTVDINGDGDWDLGVQTFRSNTPSTAYASAGNRPVAFVMGVRVYSKTALTSSPSRLINPPGRKTASLGLTAGESLSLPLITRYEPIVRSDLPTSRAAYCELNWRLAGGSGQNPCD